MDRVEDPVSGSAARAVVAADSVATGDPSRDSTVRSAAYLDATRYPDITFASTELVEVDGGWVLRGTLSAHGRTAPAELAVEQVSPDGGELRLRATCRVDRYAFGVVAGKGMAARYLTLRLDVVASRR